MSTGGTTHEFVPILHGVSPQTPQMSTAKSMRGKGFEGIVKAKSAKFRRIGDAPVCGGLAQAWKILARGEIQEAEKVCLFNWKD